MKSSLLQIIGLCLALIISTSSIAQISFGTDDLPEAGSSLNYAVDTTLDFTGVAPSGGNRTWSFLSLSPDFMETFQIADPIATPFGSAFPNADFAVLNPSVNAGTFTYYEVTENALVEIGIVSDRVQGAGQVQAYNYNNTLNRYIFPYNFGAFTFDTLSYSVKFADARLGSDSIWIKHASAQVISDDAWGKVTTPVGTYNAIRQNNVEEITDSIFTKDLGGEWQLFQGAAFGIEYYEWLTKETNVWPVLRVDTDPEENNRPFRAAFSDIQASTREQLFANEITVFPNPVVNGVVNFKTELNIQKEVRL
ncbi:MAG: hypothetical protein AAGK97_18835, partial [Bacteroidota bacterium]